MIPGTSMQNACGNLSQQQILQHVAFKKKALKVDFVYVCTLGDGVLKFTMY